MRLLPLIILAAACATAEPPAPPPSVEDPSAQPMRSVPPVGFETCLEGKEPPFSDAVEVELSTGAEGYVREAVVVDSTDPCFNDAVLVAVRQWRYPPRVIDGELAERTGIRARLVFEAGAPEASPGD